jgi:hypothetical protein
MRLGDVQAWATSRRTRSRLFWQDLAVFSSDCLDLLVNRRRALGTSSLGWTLNSLCASDCSKWYFRPR